MAAITPFGTGGTYMGCDWADSTGSASSAVIVTIDDSQTYSCTSIPWEEPTEDELKEEAKLEERLRNNARAQSQARALSSIHDQLPASLKTPGGAARVPRPTLRRTATGVRNWRAQP